MHRHIKTGLILGVHPVFGPGATTIANQNFVLTPTSKDEQGLAQKTREYLGTRQARVTLMTPREHDELMAVILGLSHLIAIVSADILSSFDRLKLMKDIGGSSYKLLLTLVESVIAEDPEFYASLQMNLPNMAEIARLFQITSKTWADLVANQDKDGFARKMKDLRDKLEKSDTDFGKGYQNMYRIVEGL
jgi:prephenate dehydrogenase